MGCNKNQSVFAMSSIVDSCVIAVLCILIITLLSFMNGQLDSQLRNIIDDECFLKTPDVFNFYWNEFVNGKTEA